MLNVTLPDPGFFRGSMPIGWTRGSVACVRRGRRITDRYDHALVARDVPPSGAASRSSPE